MPSLISVHTGIFFHFAKRQGNITELGTHIGVEEAQAGSRPRFSTRPQRDKVGLSVATPSTNTSTSRLHSGYKLCCKSLRDRKCKKCLLSSVARREGAGISTLWGGSAVFSRDQPNTQVPDVKLSMLPVSRDLSKHAPASAGRPTQ